MEFTLTEEQRILRDTLLRFMETGPRDIALSDRWAALADLGALGIGFAADQGGLGGGPRELGLVMEAAGRHRRTEPLIDALAMPGAVLSGVDPDRMAALVAGEELTVTAFAEDGDAVGVLPRLRFEAGTVTGTKALVPTGAGAGRVLVSARDGDDLVLVDVAAGGAVAQPMMDGQTGLRFAFDAAPAQILARGAAAETAIRSAWRYGLYAASMQALGIASSLFEETLAYVRVREQFGQPIGRFQVIQHRLADMIIALEEMRALTDMACHVLESGGSDSDLIVARTGTLDRAAIVGRGAIQLHGGIGMTEEMPLGAGFRAIKLLQARFGGETHHRALLRTIPV